jgi:hypothetical protein
MGAIEASPVFRASAASRPGSSGKIVSWVGTLCESLDGRVREQNYKTVRYLGHCTSVRLLVNELRLGERRDMLKDILETCRARSTPRSRPAISPGRESRSTSSRAVGRCRGRYLQEALKPASPDVNQVTTLVSGVMDKYNAVVTQVMREARRR